MPTELAATALRRFLRLCLTSGTVAELARTIPNSWVQFAVDRYAPEVATARVEAVAAQQAYERALAAWINAEPDQ